MKEIMEKFESEFKDVYYVYLGASDDVDALNADSDECHRKSVWGRYKRTSGRMYELRNVAKILGYTWEDIERQENEVYDKYMKDFKNNI